MTRLDQSLAGLRALHGHADGSGNGHTAHGDAVACMNVYRAIKEQEVDAEFELEPKEQAEEAIQF